MARLANSQSKRIHNSCFCCRCWPHQPSVVARLEATENELCICDLSAAGELWVYSTNYCKLLFKYLFTYVYVYKHIDTTDPSDPTEPTPEGRHVAMAAPQRLLCVSRADCQSK